MPKVTALKPEYMASNIGKTIEDWMNRREVKQSDLAEELGISQPAFSYKIKKNAFTYKDMILIIRFLDPPDMEILRVMKI